MQLLLLTLVWCFTAVAVRVQGNPVCDAWEKCGECCNTITDSKIHHIEIPGTKKICLCHGAAGQYPHSVLHYDCGWDAYQFQVNITSNGRQLKEPVITQLPLTTTPKSAFPASTEQLRVQHACAAPVQQNLTPKFFPFAKNSGQNLARSFVRDGKFYQETRISIKGELINNNCALDLVLPFDYEMTLSCCALPQSAESVITPPKHKYCIEKCEPYIFECNCAVIDGRYHFNATNLFSLPTHLGYQLVGLESRPVLYPKVDQPSLVFIQDGKIKEDIHQYLEPHPSYPTLLKNPPGPFSVNQYIFTQHREAPVGVTCKIEYCVKNQNDVNSNYKVCDA